MGSKKKARSRQRQVAKAIRNAVASSVAELDKADKNWKAKGSKISAAKAIKFHDNDDIDGVLCYMLTHNKIDSKILSKYMPKLSRDLQEGTVTQESALKTIMLELYHRNRDLLLSFSTEKHLKIIKNVAALATEQYLVVPNCKELLGEHYESLLHCLICDMKTVATSSGSAGGLLSDSFETTVDLSKAFHRTYLEFEDIFDQKLGGNVKGGFRRNRELFLSQNGTKNLRAESATLIFGNILSSETLPADLVIAIQGVATGVLDCRKCCWECGVIPDRKLLICCNCSFASYCSKACQKKAWSIGHKASCCTLAEKKKWLDEEINIIESSRSTNVVNIWLNALGDYFCLINLIEVEQLFMQHLGFGASSMAMFYHNINLVLEGELWFIEDPEPLEVYMNSIDSKTARDEETAFFYIVGLLSYDLQAVDGHSDIYSRLATELGLPDLKLPKERFMMIYMAVHPPGLPLDTKYTECSNRSKRYLAKIAEERIRSIYEAPGRPSSAPSFFRSM
jgi:MYND finger